MRRTASNRFRHLRRIKAGCLKSLGEQPDALEEEGSITLRASTSFDPGNGKRRIRITVADNGHGIEPTVLLRIFEPFFTTKGAIGNGLGLWVSKQIIDNHGGSVQFRSSIGGSYRGTALSIILPSDRTA